MAGLADLRGDRGLIEVCDAAGVVIGHVAAPIAVASDNGPCFREEVLAGAFVGEDPLLRHVCAWVR